MNTILCIFSIIPATIVLGLNSSYAQSSDDFRKYTNDIMNFTIQYPSNWQVKENSETEPDRVWFELSGRSLPIFSVDNEKIEGDIEVEHHNGDTVIQKNPSLEEFAQHEIDEKTSLQFRDFDLINQNKVTVGGNSAWKMEFAGQDNLYLFEICTIANGRVYVLTYQDYPSKVPETLPLANKMVESFQITY